MEARAALRRWWWVVAVGAVLGATIAVSVGVHLRQVGVTSASQVLISGGTRGAGNKQSSYNVDNLNQYVNQRMLTYTDIATSNQVVAPAARQLGVAPAALASRVSATVVGDTTVIDLAVRGATPQNALTAARAVTGAFTAAVTALETPPGSAPRVATEVVSGPSRPGGSVAASPALFAPLGVAAGGLLGVLVVLGSVSPRLRALAPWPAGRVETPAGREGDRAAGYGRRS